MKKGKKNRADIILIAVLILAGAVLAAILLLGGKNGNTVTVKVDGQVIETFPLNRDTRYEIAGADGGSNILVISGGYAWVEEADCPDGLCINMGKINKTGQSVVCLPHKVVVEIMDSSGSEEPEVDVYVK